MPSASNRLLIALLLGWQSAGAGELDAVLAVVAGESVRTDAVVAPETEYNRGRMSADEFAEWREYSLNKRTVMAIRDRVLDAYAEREGLAPTDAEVDRYVAHQTEGLKKLRSARPTSVDSPGFRRVQKQFAKRTIREFKVGGALWREHGGTCGFGTLGSCTPFEAELALYQAEVEAGRLVFKDTEFEDRFWRAIANKRQLADVIHDDPVEIERTIDAVSTPWREAAAAPSD